MAVLNRRYEPFYYSELVNKETLFQLGTSIATQDMRDCHAASCEINDPLILYVYNIPGLLQGGKTNDHIVIDHTNDHIYHTFCPSKF